MDQHSISQSLLNVVLVFAESALTLVLRFDPKLRQAAYPLAKNTTLVCVRTYLPHTQLYATFTTKGILLDSELPVGRDEPDVVINAYSTQLINAIISNNSKQVEKLAMRGATETVGQLRGFLMQLGVASLIQGLLKHFKRNKAQSDATDKATSVAKTTDMYEKRVKEQQQQINMLTIKNRQLEVTQKELESKQKVLTIALVIFVLTTIAAVIGWLN
ncbi:hypothetical protein [Psychrobacter sp. I-STPA10]|uniref:hypothetical protein n=1 Tax=Psychrobacter sp. I-STPA10 TaxID=2585769 RepID=UPI001E655C51|nr:hypothetical protein [Psychrobacter sp. I-STPA10]